MGDFSQTWVGGGTVSQIKITNSGRTKIHPLCSQISQKPWGGWVGKHIWERSPKKNVSFYTFPNAIELIREIVTFTQKAGVERKEQVGGCERGRIGKLATQPQPQSHNM